MVLSDDLSPLLNNKPAGIFLEWKLTEPVFNEPQYYQHVSAVATALQKDPPELILDPNNKLEGFIPFCLKFNENIIVKAKFGSEENNLSSEEISRESVKTQHQNGEAGHQFYPTVLRGIAFQSVCQQNESRQQWHNANRCSKT